MDYRIGLRQIAHEIEKEIEQKYWEKWLALYPDMRKDTFISFAEFKEMHKPQKELDRNDKVRIDKMVEDIRKKVVSK